MAKNKKKNNIKKKELEKKIAIKNNPVAIKQNPPKNNIIA